MVTAASGVSDRIAGRICRPVEASPTQHSNVSRERQLAEDTSMTPRSRAKVTVRSHQGHCTTLSTGMSLLSLMSLLSTCWSRCPAPSHIISVLDGLKRSLLADIQLLTLSPRQASNPALFTITYSREASFAASPSLRHPREAAHAAIISLG